MYNGWKNYETWVVKLWMDNDQGIYLDMIEIAREYQGQEVWQLGDAVKDYMEDRPEVVDVRETASFVSDLLGAALSEVDWSEIAENLRSDEPVDEEV